MEFLYVLVPLALFAAALVGWAGFTLGRSSRPVDDDGRLNQLQLSLALATEKNLQLAGLEEKLDASLRDKAAVEQELAATRATLELEQKQTAEKVHLLLEARESMANDFKVMAQEAISANSKTFGESSRDQIGTILVPLREQLAKFQTDLRGSHTESAKERAVLAEQIRNLGQEATQLTRALKGETQRQGAWGEMILQSILEKSGLREGEQFRCQVSHSTEEGQRLRPDVIVDLPGGKSIVIDAKVSLTAFESYVNAGSDEDRERELGRHAGSLRSHIKGLSRKEYQKATDTPFDYVVMFLAVENSLSAALSNDATLTTYALENNVVIATPATLMVVLRTVQNVWQVEHRNRNAEKIADRAGKLYDKFVSFTEDMQKLGDRLGQASEAHRSAMSKFRDGNGNLVRQVADLKSLGAKTSKALPAAFAATAADVYPVEIQ